MRIWIAFLGPTLLLTSPSLAQVAPTGTISGVVKDSGGLVVPNATVTIVNADSNYTRSALTKDDGAYRFVALPVGLYNVKVETTGFKSETQTGITLDVSQEAVINFALQIGAVQEQVVVKADEARVDTTSSTLGHVVDNQQIVELPLNGRNFIDLTLLQTGITQFQNNNLEPTAFSESSTAAMERLFVQMSTRWTGPSWATSRVRAPHRLRV